MPIRLDRTMCDGFDLCVKHAPEYFSLNDWGYALLAGNGIVPEQDRDAVRRALLGCPVRAIIPMSAKAPGRAGPVIQGGTPLARSAVSEVLVNAGLFRGIDRAAVSMLTRELKQVSFRRGHTIFVEGQPGNELYTIVTGKVKIGRRSRDGRENLLAVLGPSDVLRGTIGIRCRSADVNGHCGDRGQRGVDGPRGAARLDVGASRDR